MHTRTDICERLRISNRMWRFLLSHFTFYYSNKFWNWIVFMVSLCGIPLRPLHHEQSCRSQFYTIMIHPCLVYSQYQKLIQKWFVKDYNFEIFKITIVFHWTSTCLFSVPAIYFWLQPLSFLVNILGWFYLLSELEGHFSKQTYWGRLCPMIEDRGHAFDFICQ